MPDKRKWQDKMRAGRVLRIAIAEEGTAHPTLPAGYGFDIDWTQSEAWTPNPFEFAPDDIRITPADDDAIQVKGASQPLKVAVIRDGVPLLWDRLEVPSPELGRKVFKWCTNVVIAGKEITFKSESIRRALVVEMQGIAITYHPSVEIFAGITEGGRKRLSRSGLTFDIMGTSEVPTGTVWIEYEQETT